MAEGEGFEPVAFSACRPVPGASEIGLICFSTEKLDRVSYEMYDLYNNVKGA